MWVTSPSYYVNVADYATPFCCDIMILMTEVRIKFTWCLWILRTDSCIVSKFVNYFANVTSFPIDVISCGKFASLFKLHQLLVMLLVTWILHSFIFYFFSSHFLKLAFPSLTLLVALLATYISLPTMVSILQQANCLH